MKLPHPTFRRAIAADVRIALNYRAEARPLPTPWHVAREAIRLAWVSDAFFAQACYRAKARLQALGVPVLPRLFHRLAMSSAQVCIGDPVLVEPGIYIAHGQVVVDGIVRVESGAVLFPWVTIGLIAGNFQGPTLRGDVHVGSGARVLGPITVGEGARIGANAVVVDDVAPGVTVVGMPARSRVDVLSEVRRLADSGDIAAAIELVDAHDRQSPSAAAEHLLVELRHRAFLASEHSSSDVHWPPENPGRFPDVGVPEVVASDLDVIALRSGILGHGSLIVRGLLDPATVDRLAGDIRRAHAAHDRVEAGVADDDDAAWCWPFEPQPGAGELHHDRPWVREGGGVLAADSPRAFRDLVDVFESTGIISLLTEHFGERPALSVRKTTLRDVPPDTTTQWHQDGAFLGAGIRSVNVWIALSPCGVDAPSLDVVGRRLDELVESGTPDTYFWWSVSDAVAERAAGDSPIVRPIFEPGDAILFDDLNLHRTGAAPGLTRSRLAIEAWFFAPSTYPLDQVPIAV